MEERGVEPQNFSGQNIHLIIYLSPPAAYTAPECGKERHGVLFVLLFRIRIVVILFAVSVVFVVSHFFNLLSFVVNIHTRSLGIWPP